MFEFIVPIDNNTVHYFSKNSFEIAKELARRAKAKIINRKGEIIENYSIEEN